MNCRVGDFRADPGPTRALAATILLGALVAGCGGSTRGGDATPGMPPRDAGAIAMGGSSGADAGRGSSSADASGTPACPVPPGRTGCSTNSDCGPSSTCELWSDRTPSGTRGVSGNCTCLESNCAVDMDCSSGEVCVDFPEAKCRAADGGVGTCVHGARCEPACTATSCAAADACDPNGHCFPLLCDAGYTCGEGLKCDPISMDADAHGCAIVSCQDGYACPEGSHCATEAGRFSSEFSIGPHDISPRLDARGCTADSCGDRFDCAENFDCVCPGIDSTGGFSCSQPVADVHGCARRACTNDSECDCGACIMGSCEDQSFVCSR